MAGVVHIAWYATVFRQNSFADEVARMAPISMRYGATQYAVHRSRDDRYKIVQMIWFDEKADWYRYWEGPEMAAFRRRNMGHYQAPIAYAWHDELASGGIGPDVPLAPLPSPEPEPQTAA
jgi:hypothetical protein